MSITLSQKTNESFYREMAYKNSAGTAIDITAYTIKMDVRTPDGVLIQSFSIGSGITVTNASAGLFTVQEDNIQTWQVGIQKSDVIFTDSFGVTTETFLINVIDGITNV